MLPNDIETNKEKVIVSVQIPSNAVPGGCFDYTTASGKTIVVSVPHNSSPGGYVDVEVDEDDDDGEIKVSIKRSTIGAAVAGGLIGTIFLGPLIGAIIAVGAGYSAAKGIDNMPKIQSSMKTLGKHSYTGIIKAKDWSAARLVELKEKIQKFNEERAAAALAASSTSS